MAPVVSLTNDAHVGRGSYGGLQLVPLCRMLFNWRDVIVISYQRHEPYVALLHPGI